jgi:hypothetical protein
MPAENPPPRPLNALNLTAVTPERLFYVMQTMAEADLWDEARDYLKSRDCETIVISFEPILALKELLRNRRDAELSNYAEERTGTDARIDTFIACACGVPPKYPPRPPDEWPEGPWDPPHVEDAGI